MHTQESKREREQVSGEETRNCRENENGQFHMRSSKTEIV